MRIHLFLFISILLSCIQSIASNQFEADSVKNDHLLVKTEILLPISKLIDPENSALVLALSGEYKFNNRISTQLSIYYLYNNQNVSEDLMFMPEARYYLRNHFLGIYLKYMNYNLLNNTNYNTNGGYYALGVLYGHQWEFGKFNIEGFAGAGMFKEYYSDDFENIYPANIELDLLIGIQVGWKIF